MKSIWTILLPAMLVPVLCKGQFTDNFSDGNLSAHPAWTGDTAAFMINPQLQLQSNHTVANSFYQIAPSVRWQHPPNGILPVTCYLIHLAQIIQMYF